MAMGTYYMPQDRLPLTSGLTGGQDGYPESFWRQCAYPFRRAESGS